MTEMRDELIVLVIMDVLDFMNARCEKDATADDTRIVRNISGTSLRRYAALRAISDRILFGVYGRLFMPVSYHRDMFTAWKEPIISLAHNPVGVDKNTAYVEPLTRASLRRYLHNFLKILVPRRPHSDNISQGYFILR